MQQKIKSILNENQDFWQKLLGSALYANLLENLQCNMITVQADCIRETERYIQQLKIHTFHQTQKYQPWICNVIFAPFYQKIVNVYLQDDSIDRNAFSLLRNKNQQLSQLLYNSIEKIPIRVLIFDMHHCKSAGLLKGADSAEEYEYYCEHMLSDEYYVYQLCKEYYEMTRLLVVRMTYMITSVSEMLYNIESSRHEIVCQICEGQKFQHITSLEITGSDSHQKGKKTMICTLDTGRKIVYKPHTMRKEAAYHKLYTFFCAQMGNCTVPYPLIDGGTYGIAQYLSETACKNIEQVQAYFKGMGIHLFLSYLLHAGDLHQENIIASRMPVLVDTETIPGIQRKLSVQSAQDRLNDKIGWNVLYTGILPYPTWKDGEKGILLSALHMEEELYSPMKLPVLKAERTSDMYIDYEMVRMSKADSLPIYHEKRVSAENYVQEVCSGFVSAYQFYLSDRVRVEEMIAPFWQSDTRYLIRHTQQYAMYLSSALHPMFMRSIEEHMLMLQLLQKNKSDTDIIKEELSALINMDTPLFSCKASAYIEWYQNSAYETHQHLIKKLGADDLREQLELIKLSMKMMDIDSLQNKYFKNRTNIDIVKPDLDRNRVQKALLKIVHQIEQSAVVDQEDIGWNSLKLTGSNLWSIQPVGMALYDGICGIAVFAAKMQKLGYLQKKDVYKNTVNKVCAYVDTESFQSERRTGLYTGVGAYIHTMQILFKIERDKKYLFCAQKAIGKLSQMYEYDREYDLLSGNAGAIISLAAYYETAHDKEALELAVKIGDWLAQQVICLERETCSVAMGGMAHGYSGYITAYAQLLKHTQNQRYCRMIDILLKYEAQTYSEQKGNWRDLRNSVDETYANAWCHGAAGILLSRLCLIKLEPYKEKSAVRREIENAAKILFEQSFRDGLCLCHGMAGNYRIMKEYQKQYKLTSKQYEMMGAVASEIVNTILSEKMMPQDKYQVGLMTGLSGIGVCLGEMITENDRISHYMTE